MSNHTIAQNVQARQILERRLKTSIEYDRSAKCWKLLGQIDEELDRFPPGPHGRREALIAQLRIEAPQALTLALDYEHQHRELAGRALRGALLVAMAAVTPDPLLIGSADVASQSKPGISYHVEIVSNGGICQCEDWKRGNQQEPHSAPTLRGDVHPTCKHILAIEILRRLEAGHGGYDPASVRAAVRANPMHWRDVLLPIIAEEIKKATGEAEFWRKLAAGDAYQEAKKRRDEALPVDRLRGRNKLFKS